MQKKLKWTETCLVHVFVHVIYFNRYWLKRNFGQPRHIHYFVLKFRCSTTISHTEIWIPGFFHCAIVYVIVYQDVVLSVCLLRWTHTLLKCKLGSLSVLMPLNSGMPEVLHDMHGLLTCAHASLAYVERIFSVCGLLYSGRRRAMFRCLEKSVCLKLRQCWKKRLAHGNRLSETWC